MQPTYRDGDRLLVRRGTRISRGDVVVVPHPSIRGELMIKRVAALAGDFAPPGPADRVPHGHVVLLGDNPAESYDSRRAGFFGTDQILGVVIRVLRPGGAASG